MTNIRLHRRTFISSTILAATAVATTAMATTVMATERKITTGVTPAHPLSLPIKVGQIGTGHSHAAGKWETIRRFPTLFDVVGIVESDADRRQEIQRRPGPYQNANWISEAELIDRAALVVVETDVPELVPTAQRMVALGKHIHLDKPGGTNLADFANLLQTAEGQSVIVQMGYMFRYNPAFVFLFDAIREGWLGEIREIHGSIGKMASVELRQQLRRYPGGGMFELGCHLIDAVLTVMGAPDKVKSFSRQTRSDGFADNQLAVLEYPRANATIRCNHVDPFGGPRRQFSVIGESGSIEIRPLEPAKLKLMIDRQQNFSRQDVNRQSSYGRGTHEVDFPAAGRYDGDFQDLASVLTGHKPFHWGYPHDLAVQRTVLQASGAMDS
jgi:predicted dehydrogenase